MPESLQYRFKAFHSIFTQILAECVILKMMNRKNLTYEQRLGLLHNLLKRHCNHKLVWSAFLKGADLLSVRATAVILLWKGWLFPHKNSLNGEWDVTSGKINNFQPVKYVPGEFFMTTFTLGSSWGPSTSGGMTEGESRVDWVVWAGSSQESGLMTQSQMCVLGRTSLVVLARPPLVSLRAIGRRLLLVVSAIRRKAVIRLLDVPSLLRGARYRPSNLLVTHLSLLLCGRTSSGCNNWSKQSGESLQVTSYAIEWIVIFFGLVVSRFWGV